MSRYPLVPADLSLDVSDDLLRTMPHKDPSEAGSSGSSYSPYAFPHENLKPDSLSHDDKDGSSFANSLIAQSLNADGTPKRPMNAFMIFARKRRPEVSAANQMMRTGEISKILSKEWNAMDMTQKQFYLDQAKRLKDTFNSKYPDYVYRRRPNNSRKKRRTDPGAISAPEQDDFSGGDPSPVDGEDLDDHQQYPFNGAELSPALDDFLHPPSASALPSHGSYSSYPYPQSSGHRSHHLSHHQQHQQHDYGPRSANPSFSPNHSSSALRSAPASYHSHESPYPHQPSLSGGGNGFLLHNPSQQTNNYWNGYHRESADTSHHSTSSSASSNATTTQNSLINSQWLPPPVPNAYQPQSSGRERSYTTNSLPAMKSSFLNSPNINQGVQLPLPPMQTSLSGSNNSGVHHERRSFSSSSHYLPSFYHSSSNHGPLPSPSTSSVGGGGGSGGGGAGGGGGGSGPSYFPSPPSTTSSTSTGAAGGGDRLMTPPELAPYDMDHRPGAGGHGGEISIGPYEGWGGRK